MWVVFERVWVVCVDGVFCIVVFVVFYYGSEIVRVVVVFCWGEYVLYYCEVVVFVGCDCFGF